MTIQKFQEKLQKNEKLIKSILEQYQKGLQGIYVMTGADIRYDRSVHGHAHVRAHYFNRKSGDTLDLYAYITFSHVYYVKEDQDKITFRSEVVDQGTYENIYVFLDPVNKRGVVLTKDQIKTHGQIIQAKIRKEKSYAVAIENLDWIHYKEPKLKDRLRFSYLENTRYAENSYFGNYKITCEYNDTQYVFEGINQKEVFTKMINSDLFQKTELLNKLKYNTLRDHLNKGGDWELRGTGLVLHCFAKKRVEQHRSTRKVRNMTIGEVNEELGYYYDNQTEETMLEYVLQVSNREEIDKYQEVDPNLTIAGLYKLLKEKIENSQNNLFKYNKLDL